MTPAVPPTTRSRRWLKPVIAIVLIALVAWGWQKTRTQTPERPDWRRSAIPVRVAEVSQEPLLVRLKALGTVTPMNTVTVRSRVDGELVALRFEEGQRVDAGDLLAEIDPRTFRIQLAQAEGTQQQNLAELQNARGELKRYRDLQQGNYVSAQELANQEARVRQFEGRQASDQAAVDEARLQLQYTRITAPVSGRVGLRAVDVGNLVRSSDEAGIATIAQTTPISVLFTIPEAELPAVLDAVQADAALPVEAWDREERQLLASGTLASLDNRIDTATGTLRLRARFDNADERLFPNQFVNIRLQVSDRQALVIPDAAVQFGARGTFVYVIGEDSKSTMRTVRLGASESGKISVLEGLEAGERVVLEGLDNLRDGTDVQIVEDPADSAAPADAGDA
ncbi:MdtA/MuxA family multidrug efflux RND transporter periplasmic adaptor subunit [Xanthomonas sp. XNM01]|uniref:MdtA/MuxA family multidrug efflux RND transporter periplasmic adaptor subunit n=1 Tax=Xanthomonas sp. XNM01 TaxID=2769289 RepID=UPI0017812A79|nr:MdtA/MuxA family multidrug efflux RND transporter periplasmic adaptor subunit [Xanthomonas sp. XNM01]MBD9370253.1 MdtA/MuxA family multidrug efflux RND transporter periplasmic adaptor subunit [Xanthomonas sp. XNM01]